MGYVLYLTQYYFIDNIGHSFSPRYEMTTCTTIVIDMTSRVQVVVYSLALLKYGATEES